jgi:hypothetical protein
MLWRFDGSGMALDIVAGETGFPFTYSCWKFYLSSRLGLPNLTNLVKCWRAALKSVYITDVDEEEKC